LIEGNQMRKVEVQEAESVAGGYANQVLGCVAGGVGQGLGYVQGAQGNATLAGGVISVAGGCLAGVLGTVPGLGSSALTVAFFTNELAAAHTPTSQEVEQGYRDTGGGCSPLAAGFQIGGGVDRNGPPVFEYQSQIG
jgi:hypothetical protein